ncbi:hypothetical protein [Amycolatopsis sp. cmx-11-12]|uniref:hypothetical protein n=1 Tax=Amycolatopsis sp. cmx-11-12 TaxID=2785795 RepID=UPI0039171F5C
MTTNYDRRAFAVAYLKAQPDYSHPFIDDETGCGSRTSTRWNCCSASCSATRGDAVFTSADLRGIGVDDTEPRAS